MEPFSPVLEMGKGQPRFPTSVPPHLWGGEKLREQPGSKYHSLVSTGLMTDVQIRRVLIAQIVEITRSVLPYGPMVPRYKRNIGYLYSGGKNLSSEFRVGQVLWVWNFI